MQGGGIAGVLVMERNLQVLGCRDPTAGLLLDPESQKILLHMGGSQGVEHKWDQAGGRDGYRVCGCCSGSRQHLRRPDGGQRV